MPIRLFVAGALAPLFLGCTAEVLVTTPADEGEGEKEIWESCLDAVDGGQMGDACEFTNEVGCWVYASPSPVQATCAFGELVVTTVVPNRPSSVVGRPCEALDQWGRQAQYRAFQITEEPGCLRLFESALDDVAPPADACEPSSDWFGRAYDLCQVGPRTAAIPTSEAVWTECSQEVVNDAQDGDPCDGYWACRDSSYVNHYGEAGLVYCEAGIVRRLHLVTFR